MSRLDDLLLESRMGIDSDNTNPTNRLHGLRELIKENFTKDFVIAEIGSYEGVSTELFALHCKKVYAIDPYDIANSFKQETKEQVIEAEKIFIERMKGYNNVTKLKKTSESSIKNFFDNQLDAVYIDGDHKKKSVIHDIILWTLKIKQGGFICGHDYYEEIQEAINSVIGIPDKVYKDSSWIKTIGG